MAPKGGKGGGGGGSSKGGGGASCANCTAKLTLSGSSWQSPLTTAYFAVICLVALIVLASLILQTRFQWIRHDHSNDQRKRYFLIAATCLLFSYAFTITDLILHENYTTVVYLYYIIYIFNSALWRIADLYILVVVYHTIADSTIANNLARRLYLVHKVVVLLIAIVSIVGFSLATARTVSIMRNGKASNGLISNGWMYTDFAYYLMYTSAALLAVFESWTVLAKERTKTIFLTLTVVTPSLFLHALANNIILAINVHVVTAFESSSQYDTARTAFGFISELSTAGLYLGLALVGWLLFKNGRIPSVAYTGGSSDGRFGTSDYPQLSKAEKARFWGRN